MKSHSKTISHYGVKGMKWGVRRSQAELDRAAGRTPRRTRSTQSKKAKTLTDQQLRSRIERIQLERRYVDLTAGSSKLRSGSKFVLDLVAQSGKNIAISQITRRGNKAVDTLVASILNK